MNILTKFAVFAVLLYGTAQGQWVQQSSLPIGNALYTIEFKDSQTGFTGGINGTFLKTTNAGANWVNVGITPYNEPIDNIFFVDEDYGWIVGNSGQAASTNFRTVDGGQTWQPITLPYGSWYWVVFLNRTFGTAIGNAGFAITKDGGMNWELAPNDIHYVDFINTNIGLAVSESGIYKTTNGGATFDSKVSGTGFRNVRFLTDNIAIGTKSNELLRTTDVGETWSTIQNISYEFSTIKLSANNAFVFDYQGHTMYTRDGGLTWQPSGTPIEHGIMDVRRISDNSAASISGKGDVWYTSNEGETWTWVLDGLGDVPETWSISFTNETEGWVAGQHGFIFKTTNGGSQWQQVTSGGGMQLSDIEMYSDHFGYAIGYNGYILRTTNGGAFWQTSKPEVTGQIFGRDEGLSQIHIVDSLYSFTSGPGGTVFKTTDAGISWQPIGYPDRLPGTYWAEDIFFHDRNTGWLVGVDQDLGHGKVMYQTTNGGDSWVQKMDRATALVAMDWADAHTGWIITLGELFFKTTDAGQTWSDDISLPPGPYGAAPSDIGFANHNVGYVAGWYNYFVKTTDGGATWELLNIPLGTSEFMSFLGIFVVNENEVWAVGRDDDYLIKIYHTTDGGNSWTFDINEPWPFTLSDMFETPSGNLWAAGYRGRIIKQTTATGISGNNGSEIKGFELMQNYPNPFNPSTTISFTIPSSSLVKLNIYDISGRLVSSLLNKQMNAGVHKVQFDASNLAAGAYFYRIEAGSFVKTNKMMLIK